VELEDYVSLEDSNIQAWKATCETSVYTFMLKYEVLLLIISLQVGSYSKNNTCNITQVSEAIIMATVWNYFDSSGAWCPQGCPLSPGYPLTSVRFSSPFPFQLKGSYNTITGYTIHMHCFLILSDCLISIPSVRRSAALSTLQTVHMFWFQNFSTQLI
jgi:hypothetical protein